MPPVFYVVSGAVRVRRLASQRFAEQLENSICRADFHRKTVDILKWSGELLPLAVDFRAGYFECFGTPIEQQRRTRNINSFRVEWLNRLRYCPLLCGELRRRASNSFMRYSNNSIRRADTHRKTVDIFE